MNSHFLPGVRIYPTRFLPTASNFSGKTIEGIRFVLTDRDQFSAVRLFAELGVAFEKLNPGKIDWESNRFLIGNRKVVELLKKGGADPRLLAQELEAENEKYLVRRARYLLYH